MKGSRIPNRSHRTATRSGERGPLFDAITSLLCAINPELSHRLTDAMMRLHQVELELRTA
jgi:hypothetical protein